MDRFDLEQDILKCWGVVDDLKFYRQHYDTWSEDNRLNFINGIVTKYEAMFNDTFENFNIIVKKGAFDLNQDIDIC